MAQPNLRPVTFSKPARAKIVARWRRLVHAATNLGNVLLDTRKPPHQGATFRQLNNLARSFDDLLTLLEQEGHMPPDPLVFTQRPPPP